MEVTRLADGLWHWQTTHPEWKQGDDWQPVVGCVYWEGADALVLIDPLVPTEASERTRFLDALDRDVARHGRDVAILLTCPWHERSAPELARRYGTVVAAVGEPLPNGVAAVEIPSEKERVFWLESTATVVVGDVLIGTETGLELEPLSWLDSGSHEELRRELAPLVDLPAERVLTSHGASVLANGASALAAVLQGAAA